jgi:chromosome segregation ATPase
LRLYQDGLEEKIEELKKEKKESDRKVESGKKKYEEMKSVVNSNLEKISKLEAENEKLRAETKESRPLLKAEDSKRLTRYESNKENLGEWRNHGPR